MKPTRITSFIALSLLLTVSAPIAAASEITGQLSSSGVITPGQTEGNISGTVSSGSQVGGTVGGGTSGGSSISGTITGGGSTGGGTSGGGGGGSLSGSVVGGSVSGGGGSVSNGSEFGVGGSDLDEDILLLMQQSGTTGFGRGIAFAGSGSSAGSNQSGEGDDGPTEIASADLFETAQAATLGQPVDQQASAFGIFGGLSPWSWLLLLLLLALLIGAGTYYYYRRQPARR